MIRLHRDSNEPKGLKAARNNRLASAIKAYTATKPNPQELEKILHGGYNTPATRTKLYVDQHKKCAWCERSADFSSGPVDHYRPKGGAARHLPGETEVIDAEHYWWLAWTWTNLHFSCPRCNDQGHKANYFPLMRGTTPMPIPQKPISHPLPERNFDTAIERPLLLNPSTVDPLDHIRWIPRYAHHKRDLWIWRPNGLTPQGVATIRILKLAELSERVEHHLRTRVLRQIENVERFLGETPSRRADAQKIWNALLKDNLAPESELSAATWCALEIWMPKKKRQENGLSEPRRPGS